MCAHLAPVDLVSSLPPVARVRFASDPDTPSLDPARVFAAGLHNHHIANTAYPIAHKKTIWRYRTQRDAHEPLLRETFASSPRFSLYAHIPFCERRCSFCEYAVLDHHGPDDEAAYHQALLAELDMVVDRLGLDGPALAGFDIGGGTPSLIDERNIGQLVDRVVFRLRLAPGFGMSIETTPKIAALHPERLAAYRAFGIERISMGLQMTNFRLLQAYGRDLHKVGYNRPAVDNIRGAGFRCFNIDVMVGFARQTAEDVRLTLQATLALDPDVITIYRVRYKGTRIEAEAADIGLDRVTELYHEARRALAEAGFVANPGKNTFSRVAGDPGTSAYLTERVVHSTPYVGIGLGAQTFTNNVLGYNLGAASKRMDPYLRMVRAGKLPIQDLYHLPPSEGMAKMVAVSMYFGEIDRPAFLEKFGVALEDRFATQVRYLIANDLAVFHGRKLRLTERGAQHFAGVVAQFYSPAVQQHLVDLAEEA